MITYVLDRVENSVEKGKNVGFPQCFLKPSCLRSLKVRTVWLRVRLCCLVNYNTE